MEIFDQIYNEQEKNVVKQDSIQPKVEGSGFDYFDHLFNEQEKARDLQVKRSLQAVMKKDPDMVGEGLFLANELGLNRNFALDSNEAIQRLKEKQRQKRLEFLQLAKGNPILQRQLTDPAFAALSQDNLRNLAASENLWQMITGIPEDSWQGIRKGVLSREKGLLAFELKHRGAKFIDHENGFDLDYKPTKLDLEQVARIKEIDDEIARYNADGVGLIEGSGYFVGQYGA